MVKYIEIDKKESIPRNKGIYLVKESIPIEILWDQVSRVSSKDGLIKSVSLEGKRYIHRLENFSLDTIDPFEAIEKNKEVISLLRDCFDIIPKKENIPIGKIASLIASMVRKGSRPYFGRHLEKKANQACFGGRIQTFERQGKADLVEYDMKLAYTTKMTEPIPFGCPYEVPIDSKPQHCDIVIVTLDVESIYGVLPVRKRNGDVSYPEHCIIPSSPFFEIELDSALQQISPFSKVKKERRLRFRQSTKQAWIFERIIDLILKYPEHRKTLKQISNHSIGMLAYKGATTEVFKVTNFRDIKSRDTCISEELCLFSRKVKPKKPPTSYRPFIPGFIWASTRADLNHSLYCTDRPIQVHVDSVIAAKQDLVPPYTREKTIWGNCSFECPVSGHLFINGDAIKTPGVKRL